MTIQQLLLPLFAAFVTDLLVSMVVFFVGFSDFSGPGQGFGLVVVPTVMAVAGFLLATFGAVILTLAISAIAVLFPPPTNAGRVAAVMSTALGGIAGIVAPLWAANMFFPGYLEFLWSIPF